MNEVSDWFAFLETLLARDQSLGRAIGAIRSFWSLARSIDPQLRLPVTCLGAGGVELSWRTRDGKHFDLEFTRDGSVDWFYRDTPNNVTAQGTFGMTTPPVVVIVTGARQWADREAIRARLAALPPGSTIIHGAARGADSIAGELGRELGFKVEEYPAEAYGAWPSCGPRRNAAMVRRLLERRGDGFGVRVLAFPLPGGKGTLDCMRKARAAQLDIVVCTRVEDIFDSAGRPLQQHARVFEQMARAEGDRAESIALRFMHVLLGKGEG